MISTATKAAIAKLPSSGLGPRKKLEFKRQFEKSSEQRKYVLTATPSSRFVAKVVFEYYGAERISELFMAKLNSEKGISSHQFLVSSDWANVFMRFLDVVSKR